MGYLPQSIPKRFYLNVLLCPSHGGLKKRHERFRQPMKVAVARFKSHGAPGKMRRANPQSLYQIFQVRC